VTDVIAVIETPAEDITLDLDSEELHYLCQETNRPTLGVNWDYLGWVYRSSYSYSSTIIYDLPIIYLSCIYDLSYHLSIIYLSS